MGARLLAGLIAMTLAGCEQAVLLQSGQSYTEEGPQSCTHFAYCFTCMPGFNGKMDCSFKASAFCPGTQTALFKVTPRTYYYPSKPDEPFRADAREVVKEITPCT
ncbi:MAG: hypothetical protein RIS45_592 [Planctomycetota bacterium]|jgi:hypothetical protein